MLHFGAVSAGQFLWRLGSRYSEKRQPADAPDARVLVFGRGGGPGASQECWPVAGVGFAHPGRRQ